MADEPGQKKRSVTIAGHRTSISLEDEFWQALQEAAAQERMAVSQLVAEIDEMRGPRSLSSAIRVYLFERAREERPRPH